MKDSLFKVVLLSFVLACSSEPAKPNQATGGGAGAPTGGTGTSATGGQAGTPAQGGAGTGGSATGGGAGTGTTGGAGGAGGTDGTGGAGGATAGTAGAAGAGIGGADGGASGASNGGMPSGGAGAGGAGGAGGNACATVSDFTNWPSATAPSEVGARLVTNYLARARGTYHYSDACAWYGSLGFTKVTADETRRQQLIANFEQFLGATTYYPATGTTVDDRVGGIVPLEIHIQTQNTTKPYRTTGLRPADAQYGELNANLMSSRYWIDDMFMITSLQLQASRASGDVKYRDLSARAMLSYFTALQQTNGLFWHTRESHVHWGRGNGWVSVGMAEMLLDLPPGTTRDQVMAGYTRMMAALKPIQIASGADAGLWRQVLDYDQSWAETSASAMFTYSIATGVKNGWLSAAEYAPVARAGWLGVVAKLNASANLTEVCVGTGAAPAGTAQSQRDFYLGRMRSTGDLHGQAPVIWAATTFLRNYPCN